MDSAETAVRIERIRIEWDFASKQIDLHKQRYLQLFVASLSGALATGASVVLDRVAPSHGALAVLAMLAGAAYAQSQLALLPLRLRQAARRQTDALESLLYAGRSE